MIAGSQFRPVVRAEVSITQPNSKAERASYYLQKGVFKLSAFLHSLTRSPNAETKKVLIVVGGGPAPGIPNLIRQATISALLNGCEVYGAIKGYAGVRDGKFVKLTFDDVWNLKHSKGHPLGTSRFKASDAMDQIEANIKNNGFAGVVAIGGDDTASSAVVLSQRGIRVFCCTKTIDDDVLGKAFIDHTFGWETAYRIAANSLNNYLHDSELENRWFITRIQGRGSGSLAMYAARTAGAHAFIIPEDFKGQKITIAAIKTKVLEVMEERKALGHNHGVIVLAEGLEDAIKDELLARVQKQVDLVGGLKSIVETHGADFTEDGRWIAEQLLAQLERDLPEVEIDTHGNLSLNALPEKIHEIVIEDLPKEKGVPKYHGKKVTLENIGYELRTNDPSANDIRITSREGAAAIKYLLAGEPSSMVSFKGGKVLRIPYDTEGVFKYDESKGALRLITRQVDPESEDYLAAKAECRSFLEAA